jgi:AGCS family alanine or glycine:cation symporter
MNRDRLYGTLTRDANGDTIATWGTFASTTTPTLIEQAAYLDWKGATVTAMAYNDAIPGLGFWIVLLTAWLFAISTMISWSYYGEQGVLYMFGSKSVFPYRVAYCILILLATTPLIATQDDLDMVSTLGTGVMLWVNIPIMLLFGREAMREYYKYFDRLKRGEFKRHP